MDPIEGVSGSSGASVPAIAHHGPAATAGAPAWRKAAGAPARISKASEDGTAGPVRPGIVGADGRFEKLILAVQALRLDCGAGSVQTRSTKEMRAAVEEIFSIDGLPQAFPTPAVLEPALPDRGPLSEAEETPSTLGTTSPPGEAAEASKDAPAVPEPPVPRADGPQAYSAPPGS